MNFGINNLKDLYERLTPALNSKEHEIRNMGYTYITKDDIWNYFKEIKWKSANDLNLYQMVEDIINIDPITIDFYFKDKMSDSKRHVYLDE